MHRFIGDRNGLRDRRGFLLPVAPTAPEPELLPEDGAPAAVDADSETHATE